MTGIEPVREPHYGYFTFLAKLIFIENCRLSGRYENVNAVCPLAVIKAIHLPLPSLAGAVIVDS